MNHEQQTFYEIINIWLLSMPEEMPIKNITDADIARLRTQLKYAKDI